MKNKGSKLLLILALVISGSLGIAISSDAAGWIMVHGSGAVVENPANASVYFGAPYLSVRPSPGATIWIHIPIPSPPQTMASKANSIKLEFGADPGVSVTAIHVYNGPNKVKEIAIPQPISGPMAPRTFSLGGTSVAFPYGMNIAIGVQGGGRPSTFRLGAGGAYWLGTVP